MSTTSIEAITEHCDAVRSAVTAEKGLVRHEERLIAELGRSRSHNIALQQSQRAGGDHLAIDALLDHPQDIIEAVSVRQKELETSRLQCEVLARGLDDVRHRRARAAEQVSLAMNTLRKHAMEILERRYGKKRLFMWWSDEKAATYEWRRSILGQLLFFTSSHPERGCALLECFFAENGGFALTVRRSFWVAGEAGLREIRPTADGEVCAVPKDLALREAFESVLAGRADLVAA